LNAVGISTHFQDSKSSGKSNDTNHRQTTKSSLRKRGKKKKALVQQYNANKKRKENPDSKDNFNPVRQNREQINQI
jgi:hypothetical protein